MKKSFLIFGFGIMLLAGCSNQNSYTSVEYIEEQAVVSSEPEALVPKEICVSILGEVLEPGVYLLTEGSRVYEAINLAGGLTDDADINAINLASILKDEMQIIVPRIEDEADPVSSILDEEHSKDGRININTATLSELMTLPGIGEVRAQAILDYRERTGKFNSIEDIMKVSGIKESSYDKIKDLIYVK